jgi:integrase
MVGATGVPHGGGSKVPKLTDDYVSKLKVPSGKRDVLAFDSDHKDAVRGFGVRKFPSGRAYFFVKYNVDGKQRRQSLKGEWAPGTVPKMRAFAVEVKARASIGQDLVAERKAAKARATATTLGKLVPEYLKARESELRSKSLYEITRYLECSWKPLHSRPVETITRQDIVGVVDDLATSSGKVSADRARAALSTLFGWAIEHKGLNANPTMNVRARAQNKTRKRVLSEAELAEVWQACLDDDYGWIVRLLILTGQRRAEMGDVAWSEIDLEKRQIDLPGRRTKNGLPHVVPLSREALAILGAVPRSKERDLVFGRGAGGFSGWSKAKEDIDGRIAAARTRAGIRKPIEGWVLHDLRRTFVTGISESGIAQPHVVEAIVNHISGHKAGVAGVYNHATYLTEKRQALEAWSLRIAQRVAPDLQREKLRAAAGGT